MDPCVACTGFFASCRVLAHITVRGLNSALLTRPPDLLLGIHVAPATCSIPSTSQWMNFGMLLGGGVLMLLLAFFVFLPVLILSPSKFALTFSLGSVLIISSMGALRGWRALASHLTARERAPVTAAYAASLLGTLYAALAMHSYIFSLLFCIAQVRMWRVGVVWGGGCCGREEGTGGSRGMQGPEHHRVDGVGKRGGGGPEISVATTECQVEA